MIKTRNKYTKNDRAKILVFALSSGYPHRKGSTIYTENKTGVNRRSLVNWYNDINHFTSVELIEKNMIDLEKLLETELQNVFDAMGNVRKDASYPNLITALGVISDKLIVIRGGVSDRTETINTKTWKDIVEDARNESNKNN